MSKTKYTGFTAEEATVMEMSSDGLGGVIDVPVDPKLIDSLKEGDDNPMFVTIEVLNERQSNNGRNWTKDAILSVAEQINLKKPDGYLGHLTEEERATKHPEAQVMWLGATVKETNGKTRLFAKGYVLPYAGKLRTYMTKAKAAGKNVTVSVYGTASKLVRNAAGAIDMGLSGFHLESIDFARPGSEGVRPLGQFMVTAEMTDNSKDNKEIDVNREDAIKSATVDELKELNPSVVSEMTSMAEAQEAEHEAVVSEMTSISEALGLEKDSEKKPSEVIKEMTARNRELELDNELRDKVDSPSARVVLKQMVISEMTEGQTISEAVDKTLKSDSGKAVIKEMVVDAPKVAPRTHQTANKVPNRKWTKKKD